MAKDKKTAGSRAATEANKMTQKGIDMLSPFFDAGKEQLGAMAKSSTIEGFGKRLKEIFEGGALNPLIDERQTALQGQLAAGGLTRSGTAMDAAAAVPQDIGLAIEQMLAGRTGGLVNQALGAGGSISNMFGSQGKNISSGIVTDAQAQAQGASQVGKLMAGIFFSDERLKTNAVKIGELGALSYYEWDWIPEAAGTIIEQSPRVGFMAGDIQALYPDLVGQEHGLKVVNYTAVLAQLQSDLDAKIASDAVYAQSAEAQSWDHLRLGN